MIEFNNSKCCFRTAEYFCGYKTTYLLRLFIFVSLGHSKHYIVCTNTPRLKTKIRGSHKCDGDQTWHTSSTVDLRWLSLTQGYQSNQLLLFLYLNNSYRTEIKFNREIGRNGSSMQASARLKGWYQVVMNSSTLISLRVWLPVCGPDIV